MAFGDDAIENHQQPGNLLHGFRMHFSMHWGFTPSFLDSGRSFPSSTMQMIMSVNGTPARHFLLLVFPQAFSFLFAFPHFFASSCAPPRLRRLHPEIRVRELFLLSSSSPRTDGLSRPPSRNKKNFPLHQHQLPRHTHQPPPTTTTRGGGAGHRTKGFSRKA